MKYVLVCFSVLVTVCGCNLESPPQPSEQSVKILFQYNFRDEINTFNLTLTKDLILDGTTTISFWLTKSEQDLILSEAMQVGFFTLPDTLPKLQGVSVSPDPSPDVLRIEANGQLKTVVWHYPLDTTYQDTKAIIQLTRTIKNLIESKEQYKRLPPPRGGYL